MSQMDTLPWKRIYHSCFGEQYKHTGENMSNKIRKHIGGGHRQTACRLGLAASGLFVLLSCAPDIKQDPIPQFAVMEFDPQASPPRAPEPTMLVINPKTGLVDFSTANLDIPADPADCQNQKEIPVAQCEFFQYLETLDGFPTLTPLAAPVSAALDMKTVKMPEKLLIAGSNPPGVLDETDVALSFDKRKNVLQAMPIKGWDVGSTYMAAVRGYDKGVKTKKGKRVLSSVPYFLFKKKESLTCGAAEAGEVEADCGYYQLMLQETPDDPDAAAEAVLGLEMIRQAYSDFWKPLSEMGMPKKDIAVAWAFPIHSASVAEVNPELGMVPSVTDNTLSIKVKGDVLSSSLDSGDVIVSNLHEDAMLEVSDIDYTEPNIVVTLSENLTQGDMYVVLLTDGITNGDEQPLVASPMTVLSRTRGPLFEDGHSMISSLDNASAKELEQLRSGLSAFLDSMESTESITREEIVYLYSFVYETPAD